MKLQPNARARVKSEAMKRYDDAVGHAVSLVRREFPNLVGIQVHGSVARGNPGPFSDIDLLGVYNHGKKPHDFSYFDRGIYVGVGFLRVAALRKEFSDAKSFFWARGSAENTRILYDPKGVLKRLVVRWKGAEPSRVNREFTLGGVSQHCRVFGEVEEWLDLP